MERPEGNPVSVSLKDSAREAAETVRQMGSDAAHELQNEAEGFAQSRKRELGERIKGGGAAMRRVADKLRDEEDPNIAKYAEAAARRLHRAGEYVQSRDFGAIRRDLENVARRRPELFFGGMFIAGLAVSRFLKASAQGEEGPANETGADARAGKDVWK
jgi:hypothetical protein